MTPPLLAVGDAFPSLALLRCDGAPVTLEPRSSVVVWYRGFW